MGDRARRVVKGLAVGLITGLAGALFGLTDVGATFERSVGLSWLFNIRGPITPPSDVAVVAIDSRTGDQLGLPSLPREWPRTIHARLVDELTRRGASAIVFDMQFDKPKVAKDDRVFATAVDKADRVALIELVTGKRQPMTDANGRQTGSVWIEEMIKPMPELTAAAKALATFPLPKIDATVYEFWAFKESIGDAPTLPAVALQVHALKAYPAWVSLLGQLHTPDLDALPRTIHEIGKAEQVRSLMRTFRSAFENNPGARDRLAGLIEQESAQGSAEDRSLLKGLLGLYAGNPHRLLNFYGPPGTIQTVPYQAVLKGEGSNQGKSALDFRGKTVFVGFSDLYDPGQPDRFYTVFTGEDGVDLSGVEIAATAFGNLLTDSSIKPASNVQTLALLLSFGMVIGTLAYFLPAMLGVPLAIALAATYAFTAQWLFNSADYWLPLATPLLAQFPLALFLGLLGQYLLERHRGQRISKALSYYVPESVARDLTNNQSKPDAFNKVVYGTCFATDMSGFSTISEQLPPDQLAVFLNDYFDTLAQALKRHQVSVTEFRADAIMCAWTAESPNVSVRMQAILAALDAAEAIGAFKQRHTMLKAALRVGLAAGNFYVGHAGGGGHFVFSIVGDTANTASRIEGLNKHMGTQILATQSVVEGLDGLLLRPLGEFQFVGKTEAMPIVEIMAASAAATDSQIQLFERFSAALAIFQAAQWAGAAEAFETVQRAFPDDGPTRFYHARCQLYLSGVEPPDDPRVIRMDAK
jgi:adenylate cyclase